MKDSIMIIILMVCFFLLLALAITVTRVAEFAPLWQRGIECNLFIDTTTLCLSKLDCQELKEMFNNGYTLRELLEVMQLKGCRL